MYISRVISVWFNNITNSTRNIVNSTYGIQNNKNASIYFKQAPVQDTFQNNSPEKFFNEIAIRKLIAQNPEITNILKANKIPLNLNMKELQELKTGHCKATQDIAVAIYKNLPKVLTKEINIADLKDGAFLHDFGKVLIPPAILNKNTELTETEHKIMDLHTELGYQLLKNANINENVLKMVRMHHSNYENNINGKEFVPDVSLQIVNLADKFSALKEKRCYKTTFSTNKALAIIYQDVQDGKVHPMLYSALIKAINNNDIPKN